MSSSISTDRFKELLEKAKKLSLQRKEREESEKLAAIQNSVETEKPSEVDLSSLGITNESLSQKNGVSEAIERLQEVSTSHPEQSIRIPPSIPIPPSGRKTGVAADVSLNSKQQLFIDTAMSGEDLCLIGAAGTGKTTVTGKYINRLIEEGNLYNLGVETKWLKPNVPGVLITSFTRKAVNNIRRAVPPALQHHVLTMHKVLEFAPVFYEVYDEKTNQLRKTMRFEPQRTAFNPLPSSLSLVIYEESSMIGTDLYNLMSAAMPHNPQEIFIGDIRQLPPIFGPAILGFKMSLLPVVELDEVYRQALLSPIIRLAHAVLSGDSTLFSPKIEEREEIHPHLNKKVTRKVVASLEKFNENGEHGMVKLTTWQKKLPILTGCNTAIMQFIAWEQTGYYNPEEDIILCPFNKSFGTVELNKGIQNYLGIKRGATVHEVIAGFEKHYLAIGDRILYDKEDAVIVDIRRNATYMGKVPQSPSPYLDRWGTLQVEQTAEQAAQSLKDDREYEVESMDAFLDSFTSESGEDDDRVNMASHSVYIRYTYSDEEQILTGAAEVNSIIGGNAITVHKMQGSEAESIFLVLHHSHAAMITNELLYTAITRARSKLHVICEVDTFFKGVKSHKVRGVTLADKIEFFKGKVQFKEMQEEMELLTRMKEEKKKKLEERRQRVSKVLEEELISKKENIEDAFNIEDHIVDYTELVDSSSDSGSALWDAIEASEVSKEERTNSKKLEMTTSDETPFSPELSLQEKLRLLREKLRR